MKGVKEQNRSIKSKKSIQQRSNPKSNILKIARKSNGNWKEIAVTKDIMLVWSFVVAFVAAVKEAIPEHKITTLPGFVGD